MRKPGFVKKVLTDQEMKKEVSAAYVAGRWAAKEAAVKCLGGVMSDHVILNDSEGRPLYGSELPEGYRLHVSISHEKEFATAVAVLEKV